MEDSYKIIIKSATKGEHLYDVKKSYSEAYSEASNYLEKIKFLRNADMTKVLICVIIESFEDGKISRTQFGPI